MGDDEERRESPKSTPPERMAENLRTVMDRIARACDRSGRDPDSVRLVAVTKNRPPAAVDALYALGVHDMGENRVQEALAKAPSVVSPVRWHMIGHLQRNKAGKALSLFTSLHSADSLPLVQNMDRRLETAPPQVPCPFPVYLQVNIAGEDQKSGMPPKALHAFLEETAKLSRIQVQGLMTMPPWFEDPEAARPVFRQLASLGRDAAAQGLLPPSFGLSMGMTNDFEVAIEEGATVVRIGSAFFS
ncbi:MAG: YggS family pyridoxal phosphate-dependent enzyme [Planctomycetota bacterium]|jgi:pyridoxal phosphate enzyme (YggS family)